MVDETNEQKTEFEREIKKFGNVPNDIDNITKNPILKPINDYLNELKKADAEEQNENEYLNNAKARLDELLENDMYTTSPIAIAYKEYVQSFLRLLWIYVQVASNTTNKMVDIKKMVEDKYISKIEYKKEIEELKKELKIIKKENERLKKEIEKNIKKKVKNEKN